jgi:hypothetical protein
MRPRPVLVASTVGVAMLLLGSAAFGSGGARQTQSAASGVTALGQRPAPVATFTRKRPRCGRACRKMRGVGQGAGGQAVCGPPELLDERSASGVLRFDTNARQDFYTTVAGDLLLATIVTEGTAVTPPPGWHLVPGSDVSSSATQRLQVFYAIPVPLRKLGRLGRNTYRFTSPVAQAMTGTLISVSGAGQTRTISAVGAGGATASSTVTAPSITPSAATTRLLFVGAAKPRPTWTLPAGMKSIARSDIAVGYQWWRAATATGTRTATLDAPAESIGELIALRFPRPTSCPRVRILNRRDRNGRPRFKANSDGHVAVRLKCRWTTRCVGALGLMLPTPVAAGDFAVPAGKTRTVRIPICTRKTRCPSFVPGLLQGGHRTSVAIQVLLFTPNGQLVDVPLGRQAFGTLALP